MRLNSFIVKVSVYDCVLHHHAPQNITAAKSLYDSYVKKYFIYKPGRPSQVICSGSDYNDAWIENKLREWKGNIDIIYRIVSRFRWECSTNGYTVQLIHEQG